MEQRYNFLKANQHPAVVKEVLFMLFKLFKHFSSSPQLKDYVIN